MIQYVSVLNAMFLVLSDTVFCFLYGLNVKVVEDGKRTCVYCHWLVTNEVLPRPVNFVSANEFDEFYSVRWNFVGFVRSLFSLRAVKFRSPGSVINTSCFSCVLRDYSWGICHCTRWLVLQGPYFAGYSANPSLLSSAGKTSGEMNPTQSYWWRRLVPWRDATSIRLDTHQRDGSARPVSRFGVSLCRVETGCTVELGRYRYLESVSVFGIFVGIFFTSVRYSVSVFWNTSVFGIGIGISEIMVENPQIFGIPHLYLAPLLRVNPSEFHSRVPIWKTRMMGPPGDEKVW